MLHTALLTHFIVHRIQPHDGVYRFQRASLPSFDLGDDPVGDLREHRMRKLRIVHLVDVSRDVPQAHTESVQTYNLVLETICLLYTSDAADDLLCVDLGGR